MLEACPQCLPENINDRRAQGEASLGKTKAQESHFAHQRPGSQELALPHVSVSVFLNATAQLLMESFQEGRDRSPRLAAPQSPFRLPSLATVKLKR